MQIITGISVAAALVVAGVGGWLIYNSQQGEVTDIPKGTYHNNVGFAVGDGPKLVEIFFDYQCPGCQQFEIQSKDTIDQMLAAKKIKVVYYPTANLDRYSKNKYSTRSAAAGACAAEEGKIVDFTQAMFANQPPENTAGPKDEDIIKTGKTVGLGKNFADCVKSKKFVNWAKRTSEEFAKRDLKSTPAILVDNKKVENGLEGLVAAVNGTATSASPSASSPSSAASTPAASPSASGN